MKAGRRSRAGGWDCTWHGTTIHLDGLTRGQARYRTVLLARDAGYYRRDVRFVDVRVVSCHGIPGFCRRGDRP